MENLDDILNSHEQSNKAAREKREALQKKEAEEQLATITASAEWAAANLWSMLEKKAAILNKRGYKTTVTKKKDILLRGAQATERISGYVFTTTGSLKDPRNRHSLTFSWNAGFPGIIFAEEPPHVSAIKDRVVLAHATAERMEDVVTAFLRGVFPS
jgi:hypothetical protein